MKTTKESNSAPAAPWFWSTPRPSTALGHLPSQHLLLVCPGELPAWSPCTWAALVAHGVHAPHPDSGRHETPPKPSELLVTILWWASQLGRHSQHAHRARSALRCSSACPWAKMHGPQHKRAQWQHSSAFKSYPQTWSRQGWKVASQAARDRRDGLRGVLEHSVMMGACV